MLVLCGIILLPVLACISFSKETRESGKLPRGLMIPESIKEELHIICVLFTEEVGGVFTIAFEEDGNVVMETNADDDDIYYDEVSSGLLIAEIRRSRQELFESLSLYYRVFIKKEDVSELLDEEDGE